MLGSALVCPFLHLDCCHQSSVGQGCRMTAAMQDRTKALQMGPCRGKSLVVAAFWTHNPSRSVERRPPVCATEACFWGPMLQKAACLATQWKDLMPRLFACLAPCDLSQHDSSKKSMAPVSSERLPVQESLKFVDEVANCSHNSSLCGTNRSANLMHQGCNCQKSGMPAKHADD